MRTKEKDKSKGFYLIIPEKLHKDFKMKCVEKGVNMTDVIEEFMSKYIKK